MVTVLHRYDYVSKHTAPGAQGFKVDASQNGDWSEVRTVSMSQVEGMDMYNEWKGTGYTEKAGQKESVGGAIGVSKWPCARCGWNMLMRTQGDPGNCGRDCCLGKVDCSHWGAAPLMTKEMRQAERDSLSKQLEIESNHRSDWGAKIFPNISYSAKNAKALKDECEKAGITTGSKTVEALEAALQRQKPGLSCQEAVDPEVRVRELCEDEVVEQLEFRFIDTSTDAESNSLKLISRLKSEMRLWGLERLLKYPAAGETFCLYTKPEVRAVDRLHMEMRTGERTWFRLLSYVLGSMSQDAAHSRLQQSVAYVRNNTKCKRFKLYYVSGTQKN